jgi:hypothetical protein
MSAVPKKQTITVTLYGNKFAANKFKLTQDFKLTQNQETE